MEQFQIPTITVNTPNEFNIRGQIIGQEIASTANAYVGNGVMKLLFGIGVSVAELNQSKVHQLDLTGTSDLKRFKPDTSNENNIGVPFHNTYSQIFPNVPVMCQLTIKGGTYTDLQGNQVIVPNIVFQTVLINVKLNKTIEKTKIFGSNFSVKESIALDDFDVEIRAVITADVSVTPSVSAASNQVGIYPLANMMAIMTALKAPIALPIECWFLNDLCDINSLVVESAQIEQVEGGYNCQRLVISAVSDTPLIINITNNP